MNSLDYLIFPNDTVGRPIMSVYEYSGTLTLLANEIYNKDNLEYEISDKEQVNNIIDPSELAFELFEQKKYEAILKRDGYNVKSGDLYIQPFYKDIMKNYFKEQKNKIIDNTNLKK